MYLQALMNKTASGIIVAKKVP